VKCNVKHKHKVAFVLSWYQSSITIPFVNVWASCGEQ
jgi:hypothetical protein